MSWEIRVWHEHSGERVTLSIEAGIDVPEDVISSVAGSYWFEEVQFEEEEWEEDPFADPADGGPRLQG